MFSLPSPRHISTLPSPMRAMNWFRIGSAPTRRARRRNLSSCMVLLDIVLYQDVKRKNHYQLARPHPSGKASQPRTPNAASRPVAVIRTPNTYTGLITAGPGGSTASRQRRPSVKTWRGNARSALRTTTSCRKKSRTPSLRPSTRRLGRKSRKND